MFTVVVCILCTVVVSVLCTVVVCCTQMSGIQMSVTADGEHPSVRFHVSLFVCEHVCEGLHPAPVFGVCEFQT